MIERKCHWQGCSSGARWQPHLHVRCDGVGKAHLLSFNSTIECCDEHQENVKPFILSEENKERLTARLMDEGYPEPNWITARIEFKPIMEARSIRMLEPCNREGCQHIAKWSIIQVIPHMAKVGQSVRLRTNLCVCDEHKAAARPADLLDAQSKAITHRALKARGLQMRSLARMRLDFERLSFTMPDLSSPGG